MSAARKKGKRYKNLGINEIMVASNHLKNFLIFTQQNVTEKSQEKIVCMQGKIYVIVNSESSYKCIDGHGFFVSTNDGLKLYCFP